MTKTKIPLDNGSVKLKSKRNLKIKIQFFNIFQYDVSGSEKIYFRRHD